VAGWLILGYVLLTLAAGGAIAYVIGAGSVLTFLALGQGDYLAILPQRMFSQLDVFAFLAMPLFILTGELMNRGGIAQALIDFSMSIVGRLKGGLGHVNILTSVFFAGISGSAAADAAALSNTLVPQMQRQGYTLNYAAAVTAASSIIGPIIPPSIILIFYGALMNTPIAALFAAGVLPGLMLAGVLLVVNGIAAHLYDHPGGKGAELPPLGPSFRKALPALLLPVIILSGVLFGFTTPAESAGIAVFAALIIGFAYRELDASKLRLACERTLMLLGAIFIILCAISAFSYITALAQWPQKISAFVVDLGLSKTQYLLVLNVVFLVAGMVMDVKAAVALLAPIFVPVAIGMGVDPVHLGIVICFNITVGLLSPPLGGVILIISTVTGANYWQLIKATFPFFVVEIVLLAALVAFPAISLALPTWLGLMPGQ
jgi:tripartite ATP-independent transporter DctM subunit